MYGGEQNISGFWWRNLRKRCHFEDIGLEDNIKEDFKKSVGGGKWTDLVLLKVGIRGGLL
jgi:hypothetical protein